MNLFIFLLACSTSGSSSDNIIDERHYPGTWRSRLLTSHLLSHGPAGRSSLNAENRRAHVKMVQQQSSQASRRDALALALAFAVPQAGIAAPDVSFQQEASIFADKLIPLARQVKSKDVAPLVEKAVQAGVTGNPKEIVKTISLGLDAFLSVPPERFFVAAELLKEGTAAAAQAKSCNFLCLPPAEKSEQVARAVADAFSQVDPIKLQTFLKQAGVSFKSGDPKEIFGLAAQTSKFFLALDKKDLAAANVAGIEVIKSINNAEVVKDVNLPPLQSKYTPSGRVEVVAEELADALYPIIRDVKASDIGPFASSLAGLGMTGDPKEIIKTVDYGLDAFLSVPPDRFFAAVASLKVAIDEAVKAPVCNLVCVAPQKVVQKFARDAAIALSVTDPAKLKKFVDQLLKSIGTGDKKRADSVTSLGREFLKTLDGDSVARVKTASLDLLEASGSELYTQFKWK